MSAMTVGYARRDITPKEPLPLGGYGNEDARLGQNILDPLYVTCVAFVNEAGERALLFTVDLINAGRNTTTHIRPAISKATGIPVEYIQVSGTHTHSAPETRNAKVADYMKFQQEQMVAAALEALADAKPAKLYLAHAMTKNLNFVRHYIMEDGTYAGPNFGNLKQNAVAHTASSDPELLLAKITREGGKDVILCNFGVHQTNTGGIRKYDVSADIAGAMRAEMEEKADCLFAYFTGACGDVVPNSKIDEENVVPRLDHLAHGKALAKYAVNAADGYTEASFGAICAATCQVECAINHTTDHLVGKATEVYDLFVTTNDRDRANELAVQYGFNSVYHAKAVIHRAGLGQSEIATIYALSVGDLVFVVAPYEMFCANGMQIKKQSAFPMTFVLTLGNQASLDYFPTKQAFAYNCYEAVTCTFLPGVAETLEAEFISLCRELHKKTK